MFNIYIFATRACFVEYYPRIYSRKKKGKKNRLHNARQPRDLNESINRGLYNK